MSRYRLVLVIALLLLPMLACQFFYDLAEEETDASSGEPAGWSLRNTPAAPPPASGEDAGPFKFELTDCPFELPAGESVTCGYIHVLEDRRQPAGPVIQLAVAILDSRSPTPQPDPILYLSGGPGDSALADMANWLDSPLRERRTIVLLDQRGTGYSQPHLGCFELEEDEDALAAIGDCYGRLSAQGVNLSAYNSAASAADVYELRLALGYESWNLLGISYGSRLALAVMRDFPAGIRSVILDSVYPPNADAYTEQPLHIVEAIDRLLAGCAADTACAGAYPDLEELFYELLADLEEYPLEFDDGSLLDGWGLIDELTFLLYDTSAIPLIPYALYEAYYENYDPLLDLIDGVWYEEEVDALWLDFDETLYESDGAYYSVECHEAVPFGDLNRAWELLAPFPQELAEWLYYDLEDVHLACERWAVTPADERAAMAVVSEIPALILVGEYDPVTPPAWGRLAGETLPNHFYFELPRGGHAIIDSGDCALSIIQTFLDDPSTQPDGRCLTAIDFFLP